MSFAGCALTPKRYDAVQRGSWTGRALVKDKKNDKQAILSIEVNAIRPNQLRLDASSSLGVHVFSLAMKDSNVQYMVVPEKKYFSGPARSDSLRPVLGIPIHPAILMNVMFEQPIADKNWNCIKNESGLLAQCGDLKSGVKVIWKERAGDRRIIEIVHSSADVQLSLNSFKESVDNAEKRFDLKAPAGFQKQSL